MNYGLYISASSAAANMARQDVLSNNLANVSTPAFKPDILPLISRDPARIEDDLPLEDSNLLLERLGGGVFPGAVMTQFGSEAAERTGNPLDLAIEGEGFFMVNAGAGDQTGARFTRDGRFTLDSRGRLVTASDGYPVLDDGGSAIRLNPAQPIDIRSNGEIVQGGEVVAALGLVSVDQSVLVKEGLNLFRAAVEGDPDTQRAPGRIVQHALEKSGVDAIKAMIGVTSASNAVSTNLSMIANINELMGRAINTLGRVT